METTGYIFDIKKYAIHDGPGIRTTIFFNGCPMDCWWCHNPECHVNESDSSPEKSGHVSVEEVMNEIQKDMIFYDQSGGGASFSGGEPMMQVGFLKELLLSCKRSGINTVVDTSGYAPFEDFEKISNLVDLYLYDLKIIDDEKHQKYTGVSNKDILDNLRMLLATGKNIEIRIPVIPGITDTDIDINAIIRFVRSLNSVKAISLLPYNILVEDKCKRFNIKSKLGNLEIPSKDRINEIKERFSSHLSSVKIRG
ncbi:MAG: glycyl-radical enzyme activating protein [candidate division Zixibacteria bacterium]|nr:glycyl-radical enzyme activating protein [candidate division Zixibacteria bacterium]